MQDVTVAELRASLLDAMQRAADASDAGFAALVRHQLRDAAPNATAYGPAVFCLGLGRQISGQEERALPAATALGLLEEMGRLFAGLDETPAEDSLVALWGMPRTLNAGDALYALAQQALLEDEPLSPEVRLRAAGLLSAAARAFSEALHAGPAQPPDQAARVLYQPAATLAALCCRLDDATLERLTAIARGLAADPAATLEGALQKAAALNLQRP